MHALDRRELRDALRLKPIEEFRRGSHIGAAGVRVPDLRGEEFEEAVRGARARGRNKGGGVRRDGGDEVIHPVTIVAKSARVTNWTPKSSLSHLRLEGFNTDGPAALLPQSPVQKRSSS